MKYIYVFEYISTLHLFPKIYSNPPLYKMKWIFFSFNILPRLYFNIIWENIMKIFQKFEIGHIQTCTSLESSIRWHPKGGHHKVFSPKNIPWHNQILFHVTNVSTWHSMAPNYRNLKSYNVYKLPYPTIY